MKKINFQELMAEIEADKKSQAENTLIINILDAILKDYDGVNINKHFENKINKRLENMEYLVKLDTRYGMYHLNVYNKNSQYKDIISVLIGYQYSGSSQNLTNSFDYSKFPEYAIAYFLEKSRLKKLEKIDYNEIAEAGKKWNILVNQAELIILSVSGDTDNYPIQKFFKLEN